MNTTLIDDPRLLADLRKLIIDNHDLLCRQATLANSNKDVLIVNFDRFTRAHQVLFAFFSDALVSLNEQQRTALERLHKMADHYTLIGYLNDNEQNNYVCAVAALHCSSTSTSF